jgi:hypothetical protein
METLSRTKLALGRMVRVWRNKLGHRFPLRREGFQQSSLGSRRGRRLAVNLLSPQHYARVGICSKRHFYVSVLDEMRLEGRDC